MRLDRQGFSSGPIDGKPGANFSRTLSAYQTAHKLPAGKPDCATWEALGAGSAEPAITSYTVTDADMKGPFEKIPPKLADQAKLTALGYQSPMELIAERFHASPALLAQLNRGVAMAAGREIKVPAVAPFNADTKPPADAAAGDITIQVSKEESALRATRADGTLVFYAPVSSGSDHDPLPPGDFKVLGVGWRPVFNYNPDLFWDAKPADEKAKIPAGPNNPVGVVWISLKPRALRAARHAGAGQHRPHRVARVRAPHQLGRGARRLAREAGHARALQVMTPAWDCRVRLGCALLACFCAGALADGLLRMKYVRAEPGTRDVVTAAASSTSAARDRRAPAVGRNGAHRAAGHSRRRDDRRAPRGTPADAGRRRGASKRCKGGFEERRGDRPHEAIDILAPRHTPVLAVERRHDREAVRQQARAASRSTSSIRPGRLAYYYAHLEKYADGLHEGQAVAQGDVIGYVGTTGNAPPNTPHLHFAVFELDETRRWWKGKAIDRTGCPKRRVEPGLTTVFTHPALRDDHRLRMKEERTDAGERDRMHYAFICYSRRDRAFASRLEAALENYKPPPELRTSKRRLSVFSRRGRLQRTEDEASIERHLRASAKLIVVCSPHARGSAYVADEIRRFAALNGAANIVPLLIDGLPNNEAVRSRRAEAFPDVLCANR